MDALEKAGEIADLQREQLQLSRALHESLRIQELWSDAFIDGPCKEKTKPHAQYLLNTPGFQPERYLENGKGETFPLTTKQYEYIKRGVS